MPITVERVTSEQAKRVIAIREGQFSEVKGLNITPAKLTHSISAFSNSDGGEIYIGVSEDTKTKVRSWYGFADQEAANAHVQVFEGLFPLGNDYQYDFIRCDELTGMLLRVQVAKTQEIKKASNGIPYIRRGAQNLPINTPELLKRLEYAKGLISFETELLNVSKSNIIDSKVTKKFIREVVPSTEPEPWLRKQMLIRDDRPTVSGLLLFAEEPQAVLAKRCGIKVYRYKTKEAEGFRESLAFTPKTVEGCLYDQIAEAVRMTIEVAETIPKMGDESLEAIKYPPETLHEIITNAVLHRDYSIADDVHVRIFDNRIEVQSPGRLPAHITVDNILEERFARNGQLVRILNKFPDPPNKDVGEGLNTAFAAMHQLGLKPPTITELENNVLVYIRHESLASPEEAIMEYLETHETIKNSEAREVTYIQRDHQIKGIFGQMVKRGLIEQVPGSRTGGTAYRKPKPKENPGSLFE